MQQVKNGSGHCGVNKKTRNGVHPNACIEQKTTHTHSPRKTRQPLPSTTSSNTNKTKTRETERDRERQTHVTTHAYTPSSLVLVSVAAEKPLPVVLLVVHDAERRSTVHNLAFVVVQRVVACVLGAVAVHTLELQPDLHRIQSREEADG